MAFDNLVKARIVGGSASYYNNYTTTNAYVELTFDHGVNSINISNDSVLDDPIQISYDGATLEGELNQGENMEFRVNGSGSVYIKATTGGEKTRVWGW